MTAFLPPNLLALFAPRDPLPFLPPADKPTHEKKRTGYTGVGAFLTQFEEAKEVVPAPKLESREERRERKKRERQEMVAYKLEQALAKWTPADNSDATMNPYNTLFVARLNYDTSESKLKREFETYGPVTQVKIVMDKNGKSRGYAFVEFQHERDMQAAFKHGDGKRIDGRRILVDVERGRTVKGWKPRRLGGGRGGRKTGATDPDKPDERPPAGGPMRDRDDRGGRRERSPYNRGGPDRSRGPFGDRGNAYDRGGPPREDRRERFDDRNGGGRYDDRRRMDDRGRGGDDRGYDRRPPGGYDRGYGGGDRGRDRDRENYGNRSGGGDRDRYRR